MCLWVCVCGFTLVYPVLADIMPALINGQGIMSEPVKTAVVLVNLGTPDKADAPAVRRFLREFLSDQRVIEGRGPRRWLWLAVLNSIVLAVRPAKVAKLYQSIWDGDSPMRRILNEQVTALQLSLQQSLPGAHIPVFAAMTYGNPGLKARLHSLAEQGYQRMLIIPMYPQYSATTTAPIYDQVGQFQAGRRDVLDIRIVKSFYDHPAYINALAGSIARHRQTHGAADKLLFSYHGIPKMYADQGDPYPQQCYATSTQVVAALGLQEGRYISTFQSRFGPAQWLQPYTDETLEQLAKEVESVDVICPAFTADCLETLEEIAEENRAVFIEAGGKTYRYIPALNNDPTFIQLLQQLVQEQAADWLPAVEIADAH